MGRRKITMKPIVHPATRRATFEKRRIGLLKKAMELSILCSSTVSVTVYNPDGEVFIYSSEPYETVVDKFKSYQGPYRLLTNDNYPDMVPGKASSSVIGYEIYKTAETNSSALGSHNINATHFRNAQMAPPPPPKISHVPPSVPAQNYMGFPNGPGFSSAYSNPMEPMQSPIPANVTRINGATMMAQSMIHSRQPMMNSVDSSQKTTAMMNNSNGFIQNDMNDKGSIKQESSNNNESDMKSNESSASSNSDYQSKEGTAEKTGGRKRSFADMVTDSEPMPDHDMDGDPNKRRSIFGFDSSTPPGESSLLLPLGGSNDEDIFNNGHNANEFLM